MTVRRNPAFHFMIVFWGEKYRRYFTDYCLPSLLAPHNIPCILNKEESKFVIVTTATDWAELEKLAVFAALRRHIEPVMIELPPFMADESKMLVMSRGHKRLTNYAFRHRVFGVNINPDSIYSDYTVKALQDCALAGQKLVMYPGVRFEFEGVVEEMRRGGFLDDPTVTSIAPRAAAGIGLRHLHPFTIACNWESDYFFEYPVYHYLIAPTDSLMILHTISMGPIMVDYGSIETHDDSIFDSWTLDGDYAHANFGHFDIFSEITYIDDSDTFMVLGFTPKSEEVPPQKRVFGSWRFVREGNKGAFLRRVYFDAVMDPLKERVYLRRVTFHEHDLGPAWEALAERDQKIIDNHVLPTITDNDVLAYGARYRGKIRARLRTRAMLRMAWILNGIIIPFVNVNLHQIVRALGPRALYRYLLLCWRYFSAYSRVVLLALAGNSAEIARIRRRIAIIVSSRSNPTG